MKEGQAAVAEFVCAHGLETEPRTRFLDLTSELGELSKELLKASEYGKKPVTVTAELEEELGDCMFSFLCLCDSLKLNAREALEKALAKYERRLRETGTLGSGR